MWTWDVTGQNVGTYLPTCLLDLHYAILMCGYSGFMFRVDETGLTW